MECSSTFSHPTNETWRATKICEYPWRGLGWDNSRGLYIRTNSNGTNVLQMLTFSQLYLPKLWGFLRSQGRIYVRERDRGGPAQGAGGTERERERERLPVLDSTSDLSTDLFGRDRQRHTVTSSGSLPWHVVQAHGTVTPSEWKARNISQM